MSENTYTSPETLPEVFKKARTAQKAWASLSLKQRSRHLLNLRETILNHVEELNELISRTNGKPQIEAMLSDVNSAVESISYFARRGRKILKDQRNPISNPIFLHRKSTLNFWPYGVVAVISPWNFPFSIPLGEIVAALMAGNAVIFKPSEFSIPEGLKIQDLCDIAGIPPHTLQTIIGDGKLGQALVESGPDKIFFTGSVKTGKTILETASKKLIPVSLELGGKDAMIVFPDADLDYATSAALWGSYFNSGQACASTERLILHESIASSFLDLFKAKIEKLRQGQPVMTEEGPQVDLGRPTHPQQSEVYRAHLEQAKKSGANILVGGNFLADGVSLQPTVVTGEGIEKTDLFQEETFGPTVAVTTFKSISEAVQKTNDSRYGLNASIITKNLALGEQVAKQLEVGTVLINEVAFSHAVPETPWGGMKESGGGIKHSDRGLYSFVRVRHINRPRLSALAFMKSHWWFPYSKFQFDTFRHFLDLYRNSWLLKLRALPHFLWNFVTFIKKEKRL